MKTYRYGYSDVRVPVPSLQVSIAKPLSPQCLDRLGALVDTGADQTVLPRRFIDELEINEIVNREVIAGFDGVPKMVDVFAVILQIHDFKPLPIHVLTSDWIKHIILGREVLNRYRILLDGPNLKLEISGE